MYQAWNKIRQRDFPYNTKKSQAFKLCVCEVIDLNLACCKMPGLRSGSSGDPYSPPPAAQRNPCAFAFCELTCQGRESAMVCWGPRDAVRCT